MVKRKTTPPEIQTLSLDEFFAKTYEVPAYQRNYSWTTTEVSQLVTDLIDFTESSSPYYLLGSVIVVESKSKDHDLEIIDGQQRITTLMILFSVIYRRLKEYSWDEDELHEIRSLVYKKKRMQVKMSGNGSEVVLAYLNGQDSKGLSQETPTQKAVAGAIEDINRALNEKFLDRDKPGSLHDFFDTIMNLVYLNRLRLLDSDAAFEFFERVNDRGRPLSKTDLLKNRLLQKIKLDSDFDNASETWSESEKRLLPFGREGSMPYLLRLIIQADKNRKIKDSELFKEWKDDVKDDASCQVLIDRIDQGSKALSMMLSDKTPQGDEAIYAHGTNYLRFTQNHGVKLSGAKLNKVAYDELAQRLEARALLSLFGLERSQNYESLAVNWSHAVQALPASATGKDIVNAVAIDEHEIAALLDRARLGIRELRYGKTPGQTKRIRLLLALVNFEMHLEHPVMHYSIKDLLTTSRKVRGVEHPGYDIEHISAASRSDALGDLSDSVGNLTLFFSQDNRSQGDNEVELKADSYVNSVCYATKSLSAITQQDKKIESVVSAYRVATVDNGSWGAEEIERRERMYLDVFERHILRTLKPTK